MAKLLNELTGKTVSFPYLKDGAKQAELRTIANMQSWHDAKNNVTYLVGVCALRGEKRTFRLDRIPNLTQIHVVS